MKTTGAGERHPSLRAWRGSGSETLEPGSEDCLAEAAGGAQGFSEKIVAKRGPRDQKCHLGYLDSSCTERSTEKKGLVYSGELWWPRG